jgi:hypothetical protein
LYHLHSKIAPAPAGRWLAKDPWLLNNLISGWLATGISRDDVFPLLFYRCVMLEGEAAGQYFCQDDLPV